MGLINKLETGIRQNLILLPFLVILTGCGANRPISLEENFPKIKNLNTTFLCEPVPVRTFNGERFKTMFYSWESSEGKSPDWTFWYSVKKNFMKAHKDCDDFYKLEEKRQEAYRRSQDKEVPLIKQCNLQHEQIDIKEIFPRINPPYLNFSCRLIPIKVSGINGHWKPILYAWNSSNSKTGNVDWKFRLNPRGDYMMAAKDCYDYYELADEEWDVYEKKNPHLFKNHRLIVKGTLKQRTSN